MGCILVLFGGQVNIHTQLQPAELPVQTVLGSYFCIFLKIQKFALLLAAALNFAAANVGLDITHNNPFLVWALSISELEQVYCRSNFATWFSKGLVIHASFIAIKVLDSESYSVSSYVFDFHDFPFVDSCASLVSIALAVKVPSFGVMQQK
jgi:hypothetical protein